MMVKVAGESVDRLALKLEGANFLVWGGDDTHSLIFGTCKCEDCHGDTLDMEVGSRAASWGIRRRVTGTPEQQGVWALNGILRAYEERRHQDARAERLARLRTTGGAGSSRR
jgi:hypothetical protein